MPRPSPQPAQQLLHAEDAPPPSQAFFPPPPHAPTCPLQTPQRLPAAPSPGGSCTSAPTPFTQRGQESSTGVRGQEGSLLRTRCFSGQRNKEKRAGAAGLWGWRCLRSVRAKGRVHHSSWATVMQLLHIRMRNGVQALWGPSRVGRASLPSTLLSPAGEADPLPSTSSPASPTIHRHTHASTRTHTHTDTYTYTQPTREE